MRMLRLQEGWKLSSFLQFSVSIGQVTVIEAPASLFPDSWPACCMSLWGVWKEWLSLWCWNQKTLIPACCVMFMTQVIHLSQTKENTLLGMGMQAGQLELLRLQTLGLSGIQLSPSLSLFFTISNYSPNLTNSASKLSLSYIPSLSWFSFSNVTYDSQLPSGLPTSIFLLPFSLHPCKRISSQLGLQHSSGQKPSKAPHCL